MQSVSSRVWTCVTVSISYDDNHYTMGTSKPQLSSIWLSSLSGVTTPGQSGAGSDGNEGVLHIPQSSSITGT